MTMPKPQETGTPSRQQRKRQAKRKERERQIKKGDHQSRSDNVRRYRAIREGLKTLYPSEPQGNLARHLNTLAALISGIVGSRSTNLPKVAEKVPLVGTKTDSLIKRFYRWLKNEGIVGDIYFLPFVEALLEHLAQGTLVLVIDGSEVGRGCLALLVSVVYQKRALPLVWLVVKGSKGHFPEESHLQLLQQVHSLIPTGSDVVFLGDGEFDGIEFQAQIDAYDWAYVCRTAKNAQLTQDHETFPFEQVQVQAGECISLPQVKHTEKQYGPVHAIAWWRKGEKKPIYLVTNMALAQEACHFYAKRFRIETFFSDQKSRGFHLHKSHISDPNRLSRLMFAACLAYIWIIFLGALAVWGGFRKIIHRADRCDWSLFRLGLALLEYFLNHHIPILVSFKVLPLNNSPPSKSVR
jgi:hypothetical protein